MYNNLFVTSYCPAPNPLLYTLNIMKNGRGHRTYAGLLVSNNVRRIWITLTIADSFFSFSKMLDNSCSTVSCLRRKERKVTESKHQSLVNSILCKKDNSPCHHVYFVTPYQINKSQQVTYMKITGTVRT